jgi:4-amino-4-deoxy-L-arabinose transferase-like glycosyltransferase
MAAVLLLLAGGFALRLLYLATPGLDSDQAIFGLMAMHILRGELPIFQWGYLYMGTIESFVAAPLMLLFGATRFALDLSPVLFSMLFALAAYLFARHAAGRAAGLWALAFACFPSIYLVWTAVVARGAYVETLALGTLGGYFALRAVDAETTSEERRALVGVGIAMGLSFWTHFNTAIYGAAIVLFWAIERPRLLLRAVLWAGLAFFIGSAPFWYETIQTHFATFDVATPPVARFSHRLSRMLRYRLPIVLGIHLDGGTEPTLPFVAWLIAPIQATALATTVWLARPGAPPRLRRGARLVSLTAGMLFLVYLASPFSTADTQRYLVPLYTALVIAPALLVTRLGRPGLAIGLVLLALQLVPTIREADVLDPQALALYRQGLRSEHALFQRLDQLGLSAVYADQYWDGARLTFDAAERIVFANPFEDRTSRYLDRADGAEHAAFLFHEAESARSFQDTLRLADAKFEKETVEGFELFHAIRAAPRGGVEVPIAAAAASDNDTDAMLALDRDLATRWTSLAPQRPGMWFRADLGTAREIAEIALLPRYAPDAPRGLRVDVSEDGFSWTKIGQALVYWGPCSWARGRPLPDNDGWVVIRFAPQRARYVRLTQLGADRFYAWSIAEIIVRAPGSEAATTPTVPDSPGRLLADPVSAARLPGAVRHWQGTTLEHFEHLRDASFVAASDRLLVARDAAIAIGADPRIGAVAQSVTPVGDDVLVRGVHLATDDLARAEPRHLSFDASEQRAVIEAPDAASIAGVIVDHGVAVVQFPRGLVARTSADGVSWSEPQPLRPSPSRLIWSDEGLFGASLSERVFLFAAPRRARFVEISASPKHPMLPWLLRRARLILAAAH